MPNRWKYVIISLLNFRKEYRWINEKVRKAIIPAAGYGTRFLPATKALPKEMLPIIDTPTIQYIVEEAVKAGIIAFLTFFIYSPIFFSKI